MENFLFLAGLERERFKTVCRSFYYQELNIGIISTHSAIFYTIKPFNINTLFFFNDYRLELDFNQFWLHSYHPHTYVVVIFYQF